VDETGRLDREGEMQGFEEWLKQSQLECRRRLGLRWLVSSWIEALVSLRDPFLWTPALPTSVAVPAERLANDLICLVVAHELGHVFAGHFAQPIAIAAGGEAPRCELEQEMEADAIAIRLMSQVLQTRGVSLASIAERLSWVNFVYWLYSDRYRRLETFVDPQSNARLEGVVASFWTRERRSRETIASIHDVSSAAEVSQFKLQCLVVCLMTELRERIRDRTSNGPLDALREVARTDRLQAKSDAELRRKERQVTEEIERLTAKLGRMTDEELFEYIGRETPRAGSVPPTRTEAVEEGRQICSRIREVMREKVCPHLDRGIQGKTTYEVVLAVAPMLVEHYEGIALAVAVPISLILLRAGLAKICGWEAAQGQ